MYILSLFIQSVKKVCSISAERLAKNSVPQLLKVMCCLDRTMDLYPSVIPLSIHIFNCLTEMFSYI